MNPKVVILLSKHINAEPNFRWTAELAGEETIKASRSTWQEAEAALIKILIELGRIESANDCHWALKTYPVAHEHMYPESELRGYMAGAMVLKDLALTAIRNGHIENCLNCLDRIAQLRRQDQRTRAGNG